MMFFVAGRNAFSVSVWKWSVTDCCCTCKEGDKLFHTKSVDPETAKLRGPVDVRTNGSWMHPDAADRSPIKPMILSAGMRSSYRHAGPTPWMHFHTIVAVLKIIIVRVANIVCMELRDVVYLNKYQLSFADEPARRAASRQTWTVSVINLRPN